MKLWFTSYLYSCFRYVLSRYPYIWENHSDRVGEEMPLYDILNEFQKGHSHMAVVVKYNMEKTKSLKIDHELKMERKNTHKMKKGKHSRSK